MILTLFLLPTQFAEQLNEIVKECPEGRQTLLFSATLPKMLIQFTRAGLRDPQLIRLDTDIKMSDELRLAFFSLRSNEKVIHYYTTIIITSKIMCIIIILVA
jgi:superfamily II DNA/RNA helicase